MNIQKEASGKVTFVLEADEKDTLERFQEQAQVNVDHEVLANILDHFGFSGNAVFIPVMPADVGALTDAPMFTDRLEHCEDGTVGEVGNIWYFGRYQLASFCQELLEKGRVTFDRVLH